MKWLHLACVCSMCMNNDYWITLCCSHQYIHMYTYICKLICVQINLNAFASSSVFMSWVGCPWCGCKQVEKLLRRNWNVVSVWESQEPHLSSPQHLCLIVTFLFQTRNTSMAQCFLDLSLVSLAIAPVQILTILFLGNYQVSPPPMLVYMIPLSKAIHLFTQSACWFISHWTSIH